MRLLLPALPSEPPASSTPNLSSSSPQPPPTGSTSTYPPRASPNPPFSILSPNQVAHLHRTDSGCETIAPLYDNGRLVLMFMSLGPQPRIVRLWRTRRVVEWESPEFGLWLGRMGKKRPDAVRSVIVAEEFAVGSSCGFGMPRVGRELYALVADTGEVEKVSENVKDNGNELCMKRRRAAENFVFEDRPALPEWRRWREKAGKVLSYQVEINQESLDGLPELRVTLKKAPQAAYRPQSTNATDFG